MTPEAQLERLRRGTERIISEGELLTKLRRGRPLRVKLGVDPTAPDIHLGHTIGLTKLRQFQELGHHAVLIIGDFTATIGDPSGRSATRPQLSRDEVLANARTYERQAFQVLERGHCEVVYNSEWLSRFTMGDVVRLCAKYTLARMLERDDFAKRYRAGDPIGLHEFLYPLMQGYDSVHVRADVELGGTDQTFNILVGRELQRDAGGEGQVAVLLPMLEGTDGVQKMSKSLGNAIGILDPPRDMYGKIMSVSDALMVRYYQLLSLAEPEGIAAVERGEVHPMEAKKRLAMEITCRFHGPDAAGDAQRFFEERHQQRKATDAERHAVDGGGDGTVWICKLLKEIGFATSTTEARRLVAQGGVRVDGKVVRDLDYRFRLGVDRLLQVGRRRLAAVEIREVRAGR
jgi:tyrosyl-tRNA synthetase